MESRWKQRCALVGVVALSVLGLAFASDGGSVLSATSARVLGSPQPEPTQTERQLVEPSAVDDTDQQEPSDAIARIAEPAAAIEPPDTGDVTRISQDSQEEPETASTVATPTTARRTTLTSDDPVSATTSTVTGTSSAATASPTSTRQTTSTTSPTTTSAPQTTAAPPTTSAPQTTAAPPTTVRTVAAPSGDWVAPSATGHRTSLHNFPGANDGPHWVTIDRDFLEEHAGAAWLSSEGGTPVISGANADGVCLNITVTLTLRDSYVDCPTRTQNDSWGHAGQVDDAPAVNIRAANVVVEYNTITCSGRDADICSRNVRVGGANALIQYNDLSFARGAVSVFTGTVFRYNFAHDFSFGLDPSRADNPNDNVTHNNAVNNLGYSARVEGNYIVATYGRVSSQPSNNRNPHFGSVYEGGIVEVGDPINGFAFTNYLVNDSGHGYQVTDNYFVGVGRAFLCNNSDRHTSASCADDISNNVFANDRFEDFGGTHFRDAKGLGSISGSCNAIGSPSSGFELLASSVFGSGNTHRTNSC